MDCYHIYCPSRTLRDKNLRGFRLGECEDNFGIVVPADQLIRKLMVEPLHCDMGCMWSCCILLGPLHTLIHTTTCSKWHQKLVQHINVMLFCDSNSLLICIFKPKQSNYSIFWDSHPNHAFHIVHGLLKHLVWGFCAPIHTYCIDRSTEPEVCFVAEPNIIKEVRILFNLILKPLAHH